MSVTSLRLPPAAPSAPVTASVANPRAAYQERLDHWVRQLERLDRRDLRFVRIRTALFLLALGMFVLCLGEGGRVSWWWMLLPVAGFISLLPFHQRVLNRQQTAQAARRFHSGRLSRLDHRFCESEENGSEFCDELHPWASDLDLFGPASLFQLMNECRTQPGRQQLAAWLTTVVDAGEILRRQARASALKDQLMLREDLACISDSADWQQAGRVLNDWVRQPPRLLPWWTLVWSLAVGIAFVLCVILLVCEIAPMRVALLMIVLQIPAVFATHKQIRQTVLQMDDADSALKQLGQVIEVFERHPIEEPAVRDLQNRFLTESDSASNAIRQLSRLIAWQNNATRNQFFAIFAWGCGLLVLLTQRLELWRIRHGRDVSDWLETAAILEAAVSVGGYCFDHPHDCLPEIVEGAPELTAVGLGHPLLREDECVRNDLTLTAERPLLLISGSNMSGKSTWLRSIGTAIVLTLCGAVVRAKQFRTYPFQLATAMRFSDSLQEGRSLFFSVVRRLKTVVDLTAGPRTVLFLLDEILHGTNSNDRRQGAEAVIRTLVSRGALGLVTTHDLALTEIADSMPGKAGNKHFEDSVVNGQMTFDYRLRDGVVERSNAIALMRLVGLDV